MKIFVPPLLIVLALSAHGASGAVAREGWGGLVLRLAAFALGMLAIWFAHELGRKGAAGKPMHVADLSEGESYDIDSVDEWPADKAYRLVTLITKDDRRQCLVPRQVFEIQPYVPFKPSLAKMLHVKDRQAHLWESLTKDASDKKTT